MKFSILMALLGLAWQVSAGPGHQRDNPLNLTSEQQAQMQAVKQSAQEKMLAARQAIQAESKAEMAKFLSPEQMAQLAALQEHRDEHRQMRRHHKQKKRQRHRD